MNFFRTNSFKRRLLSFLSVATIFLSNASFALAAASDEEETVADPVWVLSYAAYIFFCGAIVMICIFFSKRRETLLDMEERKKVGDLKAKRVTQRRKEEQLARMHAQKKH